MSSREPRSGSDRRSAISSQERPIRAPAQRVEAPVRRQLADAGDRVPDRDRGGRRGEQLDQRAAERAPAVRALDPEHGPQDHLERDRLHARVQRDLLTPRPGRDHALGGLADHLLVGAHALAVKRGQHQPPAPQVLVVFLQQQRARAEQRLEDHVAPGGDRVHPVGREQRFQRRRVGDEDDVAGPVQLRLEGLAELPPTALEEGQRAGDEAGGLQRPRQGHARRPSAADARPSRGRASAPPSSRCSPGPAKRSTAASSSSIFSSASSPPRATASRTQWPV